MTALANLSSAFRGTGRALLDTYRLGGRAFVAAPALVVIAIAPEFVQHVVEIRLGMFDSLADARALASDPTRWGFGYVKLAGFGLAILLVARFWALGSVRRAVLMPPLAIGRLLLALAVVLGTGFLFERIAALTTSTALWAMINLLSWTLQMGLTVWLVATLVEDRATTIRTAFTSRLPTAALLLLLLAAAFAPAQMLHGLNHRWALGQPGWLVWTLMVWDSLVVGLLASLTGSALWVGYGSGASWRGWA
ncbi:hypothetical protein [Sphingomonas sp.]|jgi:hypothetical protein|uniref:hypothetical protein n=1 Tax=Sphingomonas sp. TaxID=28214 RepID=UPI002D801DCA|nr:hypothetical protein [Sphingomonas sp.]HEU0045302.1 hypothetical protein [Sphingomonas sp.]